MIKIQIEWIVTNGNGKVLVHFTSEGIKNEIKFGKKENLAVETLKYVESYINQTGFELLSTYGYTMPPPSLLLIDKFVLIKK